MPRKVVIAPRSSTDDQARLAAFANPKMAAAIDASIEEGLKIPGATDLTAAFRAGPAARTDAAPARHPGWLDAGPERCARHAAVLGRSVLDPARRAARRLNHPSYPARRTPGPSVTGTASAVRRAW